jgi:hypothetical protein
MEPHRITVAAGALNEHRRNRKMRTESTSIAASCRYLPGKTATPDAFAILRSFPSSVASVHPSRIASSR